jgi:hypothetical protein
VKNARNIDMRAAAIGAALTAIGTALSMQFDGDPATTADWGIAASTIFLAIAAWRGRSEAQHRKDNS